MAEKENTSFSFTHCCSMKVLAGAMQRLHEMLEAEKQVPYFPTEASHKQYEHPSCRHSLPHTTNSNAVAPQSFPAFRPPQQPSESAQAP
jgi:hypothetical protein